MNTEALKQKLSDVIGAIDRSGIVPDVAEIARELLALGPSYSFHAGQLLNAANANKPDEMRRELTIILDRLENHPER